MVARLVLILGGTSEAKALAGALAAGADWTPLTSFAGRTGTPGGIAGRVRTGGFGGVAGLIAWLSRHRPSAVVDATHPFARQMPGHAREACRATGIPRLRLCRPVWPRVDRDRWIEVADVAQAVRILPDLGKSAFLSTGHEGLDLFSTLAARMRLVVRTIEPVQSPPPGVQAIRARPPFTLAGELDLMARFSIEVVVAKAAGGAATSAKIDAARRLELPVVLLRRPPLPEGSLATDVGAALAWLGGIGP